MKNRFLLALVGLAISFALPAFVVSVGRILRWCTPPHHAPILA